MYIYGYVCVSIYLSIYIYIYLYLYIYICIGTHIHTYITFVSHLVPARVDDSRQPNERVVAALAAELEVERAVLL